MNKTNITITIFTEMSSSSSPDVGQESLETEDQIKIYSGDFDGYDDHVDSYIALYRWH